MSTTATLSTATPAGWAPRASCRSAWARRARSGGGVGQAMTKFAFGFLYLLMAHFFSTI